ncbi:hypothetical protein HDU90_008953 [Geranomyces variabilis]|nr:hypothetical protein HDU90_008953 [Geranomyces variabilis]
MSTVAAAPPPPPPPPGPGGGGPGGSGNGGNGGRKKPLGWKSGGQTKKKPAKKAPIPIKKGKGKAAKPRNPQIIGKNQVFKARPKKAHKKTASGRPYHFRPGTVALREIKEQQKSTKFLIARAPFQRTCREIAGDIRLQDMRWQQDAFEALQTAAEEYLVALFMDVVLLAVHAHRQTINVDDVRLLRHLRREQLLQFRRQGEEEEDEDGGKGKGKGRKK